MKFLLNMNIPRQRGRQLGAKGYESRHVGDIKMARAGDMAIIKEIIGTHHLDYGHLLAFSGEPEPLVIILRARNTRPDNLLARIMDAWSEIEKPLRQGAIVVLEDAALRIRRLPIISEEKER